ncbi:hypothetical protein ACFOGJ_16080 [Marinibaculum pumilum]|uniref:Uncharacterized protein n=1 Tax=Marinibaculum pumilum TaxID=1766165 RepID=A0ABV7L2X4_9PROT
MPFTAHAEQRQPAPDPVATLQQIARGKPHPNGNPYSGETARQMARECLLSLGLSWPKRREAE